MKRNVKKLVISAMLFALGLVLPFLTGQIKEFGNFFLPMHLPVLLCGLLCGWKYGLAVGFLLPLVRSLLFFMPQLYPNAVAMAFELMTYGAVSGLVYQRSKRTLGAIYLALLAAMLCGRVVWGLVESVLLGFGTFTWHMFAIGAFLNGIPGIILQLVLIPALLEALYCAKILSRNEGDL